MSAPTPEQHDERTVGPPAWLVASAAVALGAFLSLRGLADVHLFGDEYHSVRNLGLGYAELARTYDRFGSGLLLPLLQKASVDVLGAGPIAYRLPAILGALATLAILFPVARRLVGPGPAALATLLLAVNPIHVFYSRYGRSYSIATFLGLVFVWALLRALEDERPRRRTWALAALAGGLLPYAHLYAAALGGPVALAVVALHARTREARRLGPLVTTLLAAGALAVALYLPAFESLSSFTDEKAFAGSAGPFGPLHVATLLYGGRALGIAALAGVLLALPLLARRAPGRAFLLAVAALSPGLLLLVARPAGMPFAYARYVLPSLPFQLVLLAWLIASGFAAVADRVPALAGGSTARRWSARLGAVALAAALFAAGPLGVRRAPGGPWASSNLSLVPLPAFDARWPQASAFYERLAEAEGPVTILEAPELWNRSALLYRNHWLEHRKRVLAGFVFERDPNRIPVGFTVDLWDTAAIEASGAHYLVLHTNVYRELANYWLFVEETWRARATPALEPMMNAHLTYGMATDRSDRIRELAARLEEELGPPAYRDVQVSVWALRTR